MQKDVWFITGCSTGFGNVLAKTLLENNYKVCVTARSVDKLEAFNNYPAEQCLLTQLDVTLLEQVNDAVQKCISHFGSIDVLVNNAGYGLFGAIEEASDKQFRDLMETNVFGVFNVTRAVLPYMRKNKQGHIFNISSIAGVSGAAGSGLYNTSKFAIEGMSEALYLEVQSLGIKVTLIEPGAFRTDFAGRSVAFGEHIIDDYKESAHKSREYIAHINGKQAGDPEKLARTLIMLSKEPNPPLRLLLGKDAYTRAELKITKWLQIIEEWKHVTLNMDIDSA